MVKNRKNFNSDPPDLRQAGKTKKCPECLTSLKIDAVRCDWCKSKVGDVDSKSGLAKKPIDWWSYNVCLVSFIVLGLYIWWVFIKK